MGEQREKRISRRRAWIVVLSLYAFVAVCGLLILQLHRGDCRPAEMQAVSDMTGLPIDPAWPPGCGTIEGEYRGHRVRISQRMHLPGRTGRPNRQIEVLYVEPLGLDLWILPSPWLGALRGTLRGYEDVTWGSNSFDDLFFVGGKEAEDVRAFLDVDRVNALLAEHRAAFLQLREDRVLDKPHGRATVDMATRLDELVDLAEVMEGR